MQQIINAKKIFAVQANDKAPNILGKVNKSNLWKRRISKVNF
jgi:hypothetical protein